MGNRGAKEKEKEKETEKEKEKEKETAKEKQKQKETAKEKEKENEQWMTQRANMATRLAGKPKNNQIQQEAPIQQIVKTTLHPLALATAQPTRKADKQLIQIEGVVYNVIELIDQGGFGKVYKAQAQNDKRFVAIKVMENSSLVRREIENEIRFLRLTKKLSLDPHPVIDYYGCKITPDHISIALELAHCDLFTFWFQGMAGRSAEERFTYGTIIIMYTLRALTFLERLNIIHGDIKPQNLVMIQHERSFSIKLIDFGTVEKMHTLRALFTVDEAKSYTQFFASPEFLRRDSNNLFSRRLHKKSDAWAAGVMFYFLFLEKLPWEDEREYDRFVNDRNAKDIVVPEEDGYKLIIELLLKKDPEERASAKETLLQMKSHPVLGAIVAALEEVFHPVDDVCKITIPDSLRKEMASFATPDKRADHATSGGGGKREEERDEEQDEEREEEPADFTTIRAKSRVSCRYGAACYRENPDHREEFAHPGDRDYAEIKASIRTKCWFGVQCFKKSDPDHKEEFAHPGDADYSEPTVRMKVKCRYGAQCFRQSDRDHLARYAH